MTSPGRDARDPHRLRDHEYLPTENVVARIRRHWIVLMRPPNPKVTLTILALLILMVAVGSLLQKIAGILLILTGFTLRFYVWWQDEVVLTDRRVLRRNGVFTVKRAYISLGRVTDVSTVRSPLGQLLDYGGISIESASNHPALSDLTFLWHPEPFFKELRLRVYGRAGDFESGDGPPRPGLPDASVLDTSPIPRLPPPAS